MSINPSKKIHEYRLGDMLRLGIESPNGGTIGDEYKELRETLFLKDVPPLPGAMAVNHGVVMSIIEREKYKDIKPLDDVIVVHLRLGDVMEVLDVSADVVLNGPPVNIYLYNLEYYKNIIQQLPTSIKNMVFVYGNHRHGIFDFEKSTEYIKILKNFFESKGYNVTTRSNKDADLDFVYMCNSKHFVKSGGGFSGIIADIVKLKGNNIYYNTWNPSEEARLKWRNLPKDPKSSKK